MLKGDLESDTFKETESDKIKSPENNNDDKEPGSETSNKYRLEVQKVLKCSDYNKTRSTCKDNENENRGLCVSKEKFLYCNLCNCKGKKETVFQ